MTKKFRKPKKSTRGISLAAAVLGAGQAADLFGGFVNPSEPCGHFYCNKKEMSVEDWCNQKCAEVNFQDEMKACPHLRYEEGC